MQVEFTADAGQLTACLVGELDHHGAGEIRERIDSAILQQHCRQLVLDLSRLTFMDSSGIGLIMGRYRLMLSLGGQLTVTGMTPRMENMLRMAGLEKLPIWEKQEKENAYETNQ